MTQKVLMQAISAQIPAMLRMSLRLFYTVPNVIPLKSFSQETLSEYLASSQAIASS
jgi:hypothetical protein